MNARDLSRQVGIAEKEVYGHLEHIARSLPLQGKRLVTRPSQCLACGYVFKKRSRLTRPGRCPRCRKSHLTRPAFRIEPGRTQIPP